MDADSIQENLLIGFGNPLLDISAVVDKYFLDKYELKENDAIVAAERHTNLFKELIETYNVNYIVGGSVQNTLRVVQWILEKPKIATNVGGVGNDEYSKIMYEQASSNGVNVRYQYHDVEPTGTCAVLITGQNRSLCANLGAARHFTVKHFKHQENKRLLETAEFYYISGYFLTVNRDAQIEVMKMALKRNRPFILNLSAPIICQVYTKDIIETLPNVDLLFGNASEAEALAICMNFGTKNLEEIVLKLSQLPKENYRRERMVIITQGKNPVVVAFENKVKTFPVISLPKQNIVDTNGAGDAFTGGFLAQFILGKNLEMCVKCGIWAATEIIQRIGCSFEGNANFDRNNLILDTL